MKLVLHHRPAITMSTGPQCGSTAARKALNDDFPTRGCQKSAQRRPRQNMPAAWTPEIHGEPMGSAPAAIGRQQFEKPDLRDL